MNLIRTIVLKMFKRESTEDMRTRIRESIKSDNLAFMYRNFVSVHKGYYL